MQCPNDKHNFIRADVYTGGTLYRCDKCGLEAHAPMFSGMIFKEYFGSYIGGISHKWIPSDMRAEEIVSFAISFGDLPIVTVRYDGNMMKIKKSINGSRDGWMSFPEGYFDERTIKLSAEDKNKLHERLRSLDFDSFTTSPDLFRNFGADGFCISNRFLCHFSNSKGFECLSPRCDGFNTLVEVVKSIIGMKSQPFCREALSDDVEVVKSIIGMKSQPFCREALSDDQETCWFCAKCGAGNKFRYRLCGNCGTKRPW